MKYFSLPRAAKHVGLSVSTVRRLIVQEGKFPKPCRHGDPETGKYTFAVADLDAWLAKNRPHHVAQQPTEAKGAVNLRKLLAQNAALNEAIEQAVANGGFPDDLKGVEHE